MTSLYHDVTPVAPEMHHWFYETMRKVISSPLPWHTFTFKFGQPQPKIALQL